jgi:hypothetical protein
MKNRQVISLVAVLILGLSLVAGSGCSRGYQRYIPSEDKAKQALEAALSAWQEGKKPGVIDGAPMALEAVDSQWQRGQQLRSYEILNEEPNENGPRVFAVKLVMARPANKEVTVRYFIVGKEPLWVYREDDYKAPAGM